MASDYCSSEWEISRARAYKYIKAHDVVDDILQDEPVPHRVPERESHARMLSRLRPDDRRKTWRRVLRRSEKTGKTITADAMKHVRDELLNSRKEAGSSRDNRIWSQPSSFPDASILIPVSRLGADADELKLTKTGAYAIVEFGAVALRKHGEATNACSDDREKGSKMKRSRVNRDIAAWTWQPVVTIAPETPDDVTKVVVVADRFGGPMRTLLKSERAGKEAGPDRNVWLGPDTDLYDEAIPKAVRSMIFQEISEVPQLNFLLTPKYPERVVAESAKFPLPVNSLVEASVSAAAEAVRGLSMLVGMKGGTAWTHVTALDASISELPAGSWVLLDLPASHEPVRSVRLAELLARKDIRVHVRRPLRVVHEAWSNGAEHDERPNLVLHVGDGAATKAPDLRHVSLRV